MLARSRTYLARQAAGRQAAVCYVCVAEHQPESAGRKGTQPGLYNSPRGQERGREGGCPAGLMHEGAAATSALLQSQQGVPLCVPMLFPTPLSLCCEQPFVPATQPTPCALIRTPSSRVPALQFAALQPWSVSCNIIQVVSQHSTSGLQGLAAWCWLPSHSSSAAWPHTPMRLNLLSGARPHS